MTKVVQEFLWAQKVQEPIALYSDWLVVGHVDEFMTFVPAPDRKVNTLLLRIAYYRTSAKFSMYVVCVDVVRNIIYYNFL